MSVALPPGAVAEDVRIEYRSLPHWPSTGMKMVRLFELKGYAVKRSDAAVSAFQKELQVTIKHDSDELRGIDIRSLRLYYLDEPTGSWQPVSGQFDPETRTLTASVDHFTEFGEQASPLISGPGLVMAFQNDLHSGAATGSYPIEVPPGPGGFQPKIELSYNSGAVDEMKNRMSVASWVGLGWSLNLGRITYDEASDKYTLDLNGAGYELVSNGSSTYITRPDQFLKITRGGNGWEVWDRDGTYYLLGGYTDAMQYHDDSIYYRWDVSAIRDTNNNIIRVYYVQDIFGDWGGSTVRSAYPSLLTYSSQGSERVRVYFNTSSRNDTPPGNGYYPAPPIMENKKLDSIEIQMFDGSAWKRVRKYDFSYNSTPPQYSTDYGGIYYAGTLTLVSITQKDKNDSLSLPVTAFSYENKQTYLRDSQTGAYAGNPGNPASLNWPHLTAINNGYGAAVSTPTPRFQRPRHRTSGPARW